MGILRFRVEGVAKSQPRRTRRDKWNPSLGVVAYYEWCDIVRHQVVGDPLKKFDFEISRINALFVLPIPPSYSKKQRTALAGQPHRVKPDVDNLLKGILDALFLNDSCVWCAHAEKWWCNEGQEPHAILSLEAD